MNQVYVVLSRCFSDEDLQIDSVHATRASAERYVEDEVKLRMADEDNEEDARACFEIEVFSVHNDE